MDCCRRRRMVCVMTSVMMMCVQVWVCHFHSSTALSIPVIPEESQRRSSFKPTSRFALGVGTRSSAASPFSTTNTVGSRSNFVDSKRKMDVFAVGIFLNFIRFYRQSLDLVSSGRFGSLIQRRNSGIIWNIWRGFFSAGNSLKFFFFFPFANHRSFF